MFIFTKLILIQFENIGSHVNYLFLIFKLRLNQNEFKKYSNHISHHPMYELLYVAEFLTDDR